MSDYLHIQQHLHFVHYFEIQLIQNEPTSTVIIVHNCGNKKKYVTNTGQDLWHANKFIFNMCRYISEPILIMEDDIVIKDKLVDKYFNYLEKIKEFDNIIFSGNDKKERINDLISKAIHISTTGMYLVKNHYYQTLIDNFQEAVNKMEQNITKNKDIDRNNNAIDVNWKKLQKKDNWIIFNENLGYQEPGFSDIENRNVDYLWCLN